MDRVYQANAIETPPSATASSGSYPTAGNKAYGQLATVPGPYWFYSITEEIRNALIAAGITPDAAKVNQLAEAMGKYLPLSGGTMTGTVTFTVPAVINQATATSYTTIRGGTTNSDGARLVLTSKGDSGKGLFRVYAHDGTNSPSLMGTPDGILKWNNKDVVRSVNGTVADGDGNVTVTVDTANKATATPNVYVAVKSGTFTLPSGGTWTYLIYSQATAEIKKGTASGGTKLSLSYGTDSSAIIAIRTK